MSKSKNGLDYSPHDLSNEISKLKISNGPITLVLNRFSPVIFFCHRFSLIIFDNLQFKSQFRRKIQNYII